MAVAVAVPEKDPHVGIWVPFLWEEQPGIAKKEWKLNDDDSSTWATVSPPSSSSSPQPFIKAIDSVWDETQTHSTTSSYVDLMDSPPLPLPPALISVRGGETTAYYDHELRRSRSDEEANQFQYPKSHINNTTLVATVPPRPFKLVGSVPFTWEAKPGTPLSSFSWPWVDMPETDRSHPTDQANQLLLLPPHYCGGGHEENNHVSEQEQIPNLDICLQQVKTSTVMRVPSPPPKFVASVPFSWEEKPGKPLPSWVDFFGTDQQTNSNQREGHGNNSSQYNQLFEFDVESFSFDTNESLSSEPSLIPNCLFPSASISNAVPAVQTNPFLAMDEDPQSDTCSDTSSYETEAASFVGSSLLEWLFPNFPPKVGILEKNESSCKRVPEKVNSQEQLEAGPTDFGSSINGSFAIRKPKTLGELIMMSRRRSYVRKAAQVQKQNPSMHDFVKRSTFGCWTFGQGLNLKRQLRLKMV